LVLRQGFPTWYYTAEEKKSFALVPTALSALQSRVAYALNERKQQLILMRKAPYIISNQCSVDKGVRLL
jgi:hypothetical protein